MCASGRFDQCTEPSGAPDGLGDEPGTLISHRLEPEDHVREQRAL